MGFACSGRFVGGLSSLHIFFSSNNRTTYEHFRSRNNHQGNPYDVGCAENWKQVLMAACYALAVWASE
jgi:hypothetical protein